MATSTAPQDTVYVIDNTGTHFVVDIRTMKRYEVAGPGERDAAKKIWGAPITKGSALPDVLRIGQNEGRKRYPGKFRSSNWVYLDMRLGYKPGGRLMTAFGGPNQLERYLAGQVEDPFRGQRNPEPRPVVSREGKLFRPSAIDPDGPPSDARMYIEAVLKPFGLDSPRLMGLIDGLIKDGAGEDVMWAEIKATEEYKQRFAGNVQRVKAGLPELSPAQYVQVEQQMSEILTIAGVPPGFHDDPEDFAQWIGSGMSPSLLADRVNRGVRQVASASSEVLEAFEEMFPGEGANALLAFALDPDTAQPLLERRVMQGQLMGVHRRRQFDLSADVRDEVVARAQEMGLTPDQVRQAAEQSSEWLGQRRQLFDESLGETTDLDAGDEGARATLLGDDAAARAIDRRLSSRQATQAGAGGASTTEKGLAL